MNSLSSSGTRLYNRNPIIRLIGNPSPSPSLSPFSVPSLFLFPEFPEFPEFSEGLDLDIDVDVGVGIDTDIDFEVGFDLRILIRMATYRDTKYKKAKDPKITEVQRRAEEKRGEGRLG